MTALSSVDPIAPSSRAIPTSIDVTDFVSENNWNRRCGPANRPDVVVVKTSAWPVADDPALDGETVTALTALVAHLSADG